MSVGKGGKELSVNVGGFIVNKYYHFRRSTKRKNQLKEFMKFNNNEVRWLRWLNLGKCLERRLMQWDSLESYFLSNFDLDDDPTENDPNEKPRGENRLANAFKHPVSKLHTIFVQSVIPIFDSFSTFLPFFHYSTLRLYRSLLSRFILPEVISK